MGHSKILHIFLPGKFLKLFGVHDKAGLSKCEIQILMIFNEPIQTYLSESKNINIIDLKVTHFKL